MYRVMATLLIALMFLTGCTKPTDSIEGPIEDISDSSFVINCSDEVNRGKKGPINGIGYRCSVEFTDQTVFRDMHGNSLTVNEFISGSTVKVTLSEPVDLRKRMESDKPLGLVANDVILLTREQVSSKEVMIKELEKQGLDVIEGVRDPQSSFQISLGGIEPQVYSVNGEEVILFQFPSEEEQLEGWVQFLEKSAAMDIGAFKNYNLDSFLLILKYGEDLNTQTDKKIQRAIDELASY